MNLETLNLSLLLVGAALVVAIAVVLARLYKRSSKELSFVRTGLGGEKVILDGGCLSFPVLHEIMPVNMRTLRLQVDRKNEEGLITADRMRVDVTAEFYVRVKPEKESIAKAAQTLGNRTLEPETLKELLQGKFVDALRSVAAGLSMEQLHERRAEFVQSVQTSVSEDLLKNGLELESVSLTALDQTARQFFKEDNAFDAQGLAKLTQITEAKREERNRIEQETRIQIEVKNLDAEKKSLDIKRDEEMARLTQKREIEVTKAEQGALIARQQATRKREAEEARIGEDQKEKEAAINAEQAVRERDIVREQSIQERDLAARRNVEEADVLRQQTVDISRQSAAIAVAKKSEEQSKAEAEAAKARSLRVQEEEKVETIKETAIAERAKSIRLIKVSEKAEEDALIVTIAAEAEKKAAADKAEALLTESRAQSEKIRILAEADHKRLEVEAYGEQAINEAKNMLKAEIMAFELRKLIAEVTPRIIEASVKPIEKIDSIKIISTNGFTMPGSNSAGGPVSPGSGSLSSQLVDALLGYRMQSPLVDKLLAELGLDSATTAGMTETLSQAIEPKAAEKGDGEKESSGQQH